MSLVSPYDFLRGNFRVSSSLRSFLLQSLFLEDSSRFPIRVRYSFRLPTRIFIRRHPPYFLAFPPINFSADETLAPKRAAGFFFPRTTTPLRILTKSFSTQLRSPSYGIHPSSPRKGCFLMRRTFPRSHLIIFFCQGAF